MKTHLSHQQGVSLIEALVALIVLSLGAIGVAGVQLGSIKFNQVSQQRSFAVHHLTAMTDRMRGNMAAVAAGQYTFNFNYGDIPGNIPAATGCSVNCTSQQIANQHLRDWLLQLAAALPNGRGTITQAAITPGAPYLVTVMWEEKDLTGALRDARCPATAPATAQCIVADFQP